MNYLTNIIQSVNETGYQKNQNNLKKLFELLYYTNFYINIDVIKDKFIINNSNFLIKFYSQIISGILQLFPNNYSTKDYKFSNIIPLVYIYFSTFNNLNENSNDVIVLKKTINTKIVELVKNNYSSYILKHKYQFNTCHLAIFYFLFLLKDSDNKDLLSFISNNIIKCLNIEDIKLDNSNFNLNSFYFISLNFFILILIYQENYNKNITSKLSKKRNHIMSFLDIKSPIIIYIYEIIKDYLEDINKNIDKINQDETIINESDKKANFINENLKFNVKTNYIDISFMKEKYINIYNDENQIIDTNIIKNLEKIKVENDLLEKNKTFIYNYQMWIIFTKKIPELIKLKKRVLEQEIKKNEDLLKDVFSFYKNKMEIKISLIKSEEINDKDISLFIQLFTNIGEIITEENKLQFQKEYEYRKYIIHLDKKELDNILLVLIKDNFHEIEDSILSGKNIIYIKPLPIKSVYSIKIHKISNEKISSEFNPKILRQLEDDINLIFSDYMIIDFNNEKQVDYFFSIIHILFYYSLLDQFINCERICKV